MGQSSFEKNSLCVRKWLQSMVVGEVRTIQTSVVSRDTLKSTASQLKNKLNEGSWTVRRSKSDVQLTVVVRKR